MQNFPWKNALLGVAMLVLALAGWFLPADQLQPLPDAAPDVAATVYVVYTRIQ